MDKATQDMILADAIQVAIEKDRECRILKGVVGALSVTIVIMVVTSFVR